MNYTVRNSRPSDNGQLGDIYLNERRQTFTWVDPGKFSHEDFLAHSQGEIVWVAEAPDGEIAGFMTLWAADDFIHMLYIRKQWQGRGVRYRVAEGSAGVAAPYIPVEVPDQQQKRQDILCRPRFRGHR